MARFGKLPVTIPENVQVEIAGQKVKITGPKGMVERVFPQVTVKKTEEDKLLVEQKGKSRQARAQQGTVRSHLANMLAGVVSGWGKKLELVGSGYRAEVRGSDLVLTVGYSHPVVVAAPAGITFKVEKSIISIDGLDKEVVGQVAAKVRAVRPPEPYKGKGVRYVDEVVRRKPGKQAAKTTA